MKTKIEIIQETAEFYGADPEARRATSFGSCYYHLKCSDGTTRHCAVGRCAENPNEIPSGRISEHNISHIKWKPGYEGHELEFWQDLQRFHDTGHLWSNKKGLTSTGIRSYNSLLQKYGHRS